jgi:hypothetical protein
MSSIICAPHKIFSILAQKAWHKGFQQDICQFVMLVATEMMP